MFEHFGHFKNITGAHLVGKILEAILPIVGRRGKIAGQGCEKRVAFGRGNRTTQANFTGIRHWNQDQRIGCGQSKSVKRQRYRSDLLLFDLFDCADTVVWINNFLADLEAYHNPLRLVLRALGKTHADGLLTKTLCEMCVRVCPLNLNWVESSKPYREASSLPRCDDCVRANVGPPPRQFPFVI